MKRFYLIGTFLSLFIINGCGGGGSTNDIQSTSSTTSDTTTTINGKVVDGEIKGATVFFDINRDGVLDTNEPSTTSNEKGEFKLKISTALANDYSIPFVSIGGYDIREKEDFNLTLMAFRENHSNSVTLTPLTTLVAFDVLESLSVDSKNSNKLKVNSTITADELFALLNNAKKSFAELFNLEMEILTKDPIELALEKGNLELLETNMKINKVAREIKKGIKQELRDKQKDAIESFRALTLGLKKAKKEAKRGDEALEEAVNYLAEVAPDAFDKDTIPSIRESVKYTINQFNQDWKDNRDEIITTLEDTKNDSIDNTDSNESTQSVETVVDTTPPTITLNGDNPQIIELGNAYQELGAEVSDNIDENPTLEIDSSQVDVSKLGQYQVIYKAKDRAGNEASVTRVVKLIKKTIKTIEPLEKLYNFGTGNYSLQNAPLGMRILNNGLLTWTPSPSQVGDINVTVLKDGVKVANLIVEVEDSGKVADGYFVDMTFPAYNRDEDGSEEHPYGDIERACGHSKPGDIFYARGGVYTTPEYMENNNSNRGFKVVGCKGTADNPVIFKPWGNESVKIVSDATTGIAIFNSEHVIVDGFEVEGVSQKISFEEVVGQWWNDLKYYNGSGISMNQNTHDIVVQNCVVHDVPASGIKSHGATHITIKDNIVYNTNWWTTLGTTGVGIVSAPPLEGEDNSTYYNKIVGNLLFGSEQRLYSRVWFKKGSEFVIDEGEAVLVQEVMRTKTDENGNTYRTDYEGRYLVQDNLLAYNGAGIVINISNKSDVINNTLYMSGTTTLNPYTNLSYSCITANSSYDVKMIKNIVKAKENGIVIWYNKEVKDLYKEENHVSGHVLRYDFMNQDGLVIYDKNATLLKSDFSPIDELKGIGANNQAIMAKAKKLGIEIKPTNYVIDYPKLTQAIFDAMPDDVKVLRIDDTSSSRSTSIFVKLPNKDEEYYLRVPNRYLEGVKLPEVTQE